jgi:hypothetical protein
MIELKGTIKSGGMLHALLGMNSDSPEAYAESAGSVTITHAATVGNGATYNIVCTVN